MSDANAGNTRSAAQIERDLDDTRARLNHDLGTLEDRMSPNQLIDQAVAYLRTGQGAAFTRNLGASARDNPLPVVLVGVGLAWLMASGPASRHPVRTARHTPPRPYDLHERAHHAGLDVIRLPDETEETHRSRMDDARGAVFGMKRHAQEASESFSGRIQDAMNAARDWAATHAASLHSGASTMGSSMSDSAHRVSDHMGDWANSTSAAAGESFSRNRDMISRRSGTVISSVTGNPMLLGALGVTAGALLGGVLPHFEVEDQYLGDAGDTVRNTVQDAAQNAYHRGEQAVQATMDAGRAAARDQGLTSDQSASDITAKARNVAETALQAGKSAATADSTIPPSNGQR